MLASYIRGDFIYTNGAPTLSGNLSDPHGSWQARSCPANLVPLAVNCPKFSPYPKLSSQSSKPQMQMSALLSRMRYRCVIKPSEVEWHVVRVVAADEAT